MGTDSDPDDVCPLTNKDSCQSYGEFHEYLPIVVASERGHIQCLKQMSGIEAGVDFSWHGVTPLLYACMKGHEQIAELLINQYKADPNKNQVGHNSSPLRYAAQLGHIGICKILLENGAELNVVSF